MIKRIKMPKIKSHKATSKRFRLTGSGKLMRTRQGKSHFRRNRSQRTINELDTMQVVQGNAIARKIKALVPTLSDQ
ncbi:MAG: 50S ribosomal protein L35 [Chloroflexi bacterium]|nr:50S ribosomal protein L35 [Chloroflexota bacterium]